jgi:hypothetical protein
MGLLLLSDEVQDFALVVKEIAQRMEHLGLGDPQGLGDVENGIALTVERDYVPDRDTKAVDDWFAAADAFQADDVGMFGLNGSGHGQGSGKRE